MALHILQEPPSGQLVPLAIRETLKKGGEKNTGAASWFRVYEVQIRDPEDVVTEPTLAWADNREEAVAFISEVHKDLPEHLHGRIVMYHLTPEPELTLAATLVDLINN